MTKGGARRVDLAKEELVGELVGGVGRGRVLKVCHSPIFLGEKDFRKEGTYRIESHFGRRERNLLRGGEKSSILVFSGEVVSCRGRLTGNHPVWIGKRSPSASFPRKKMCD